MKDLERWVTTDPIIRAIKDRYKSMHSNLLKMAAYYAFDTSGRCGRWTEARSNKETFIYNPSQQAAFKTLWRLLKAEVTERLERGDEYVIRFKPQPKTCWHDESP
jgi:glutamyl-tRNA synthetase